MNFTIQKLPDINYLGDRVTDNFDYEIHCYTYDSSKSLHYVSCNIMYTQTLGDLTSNRIQLRSMPQVPLL